MVVQGGAAAVAEYDTEMARWVGRGVAGDGRDTCIVLKNVDSFYFLKLQVMV